MSIVKDTLAAVLEGGNLDSAGADACMRAIMTGEATDAQIGALLAALRMKGETVDEIAGFVSAMRSLATQVKHSFPVVLDTCGTGGDRKGTFNISTAVAFVAAGAGIAVAKHGNRAVSSKCGSADVLRALGVNIDLSPDKVGLCFNKIGLAFLFAPFFHPAMKNVMGPRREMGVRTVFNILGPMTNPAGANAQLLGVFDPALCPALASVLGRLGTKRAFVVHGMDGTDEVSACGPTAVAELKDGKVGEYTVSPADFGFADARQEDMLGDAPEENAAIIVDILNGKPSRKLDAVLLNAGFALAAGGRADSPKEGIEIARKTIADGAALAKLEELRKTSNDIG